MPIMLVPSVTTAEQLLTLHEPGCRHELVRGEVRRMSPAGHWHGAIAARIAALLDTFLRKHELGLAFGAETGFVLARDPDTVRAPDAAFVRAERVLPPGPGYFAGPPDLAVEVISPTDTFSEVHAKALAWLDHGARAVWLVDPTAHTVTVLHARDSVRVLAETDELSGGDVLPGFACAVRELFPSLPTSPSR